MKTSEVIKKHRKLLGLTQEELGERIGVQKSAIAKYENDIVTNLKRSTIEKLAEVFNITPTEVMGIEDDYYKGFETPEQAINFLLNENVIKGYNGLDVADLDEETQMEYANELLEQMKLVSYKYKDKLNNEVD